MTKERGLLARILLGGSLLLSQAAVSCPLPDEYDIKWYTIDGGAGEISQNSSYRLFGSIGQSDAGYLVGEKGLNLSLVQGGFLQGPSLQALNSAHDFQIVDYEIGGGSGILTSDELASTYLRDSSPTLEVSGNPGDEIQVLACLVPEFDERADNAWITLVSSATIAGGQSSVRITLGEPPNQALPDEEIIHLKIRWLHDGQVKYVRIYENVKVDSLPPRNLYALAPAGDFYARLDVQRPNIEDIPDAGDACGFYCTDAVDGMTAAEDIQYWIELYDNRTQLEEDEPIYQSTPVVGNLPVESFRLGTSFSATPALTLARGKYPKNVIPWKEDVDGATGIKTDVRGTGQYFWRVCAKDDAGNVAVSTASEVWVPQYDETLWLNTYDDAEDPDPVVDAYSRIRVALWMPNDRFLSEWSPYTQEICFPDVWINEFNSQVGTGEQRFIELACAGNENRSLDGWKLEVLDGDTGLSYTTISNLPELAKQTNANLCLSVVNLDAAYPVHPAFILRNRCNTVVWKVTLGGSSSAYTNIGLDSAASDTSCQTLAGYVSAMSQSGYAGGTSTPGRPNSVSQSDQVGASNTLISKALVTYKDAFSPTVFDSSNPQVKNKAYAEYVWRSARRWQTFLEAYAESAERQQYAPSGAAYAYWYNALPGASAKKLRANYARLESDGRLRLEIYRDRYVREQDMYDLCNAVGRTSDYLSSGVPTPTPTIPTPTPTPMPTINSTLLNGYDAYLQRIGKVDGTVPYPQMRELGRRNVIIAADDWSGINWRWMSWGAMKVVSNGQDFFARQVDERPADAARSETGSSWFDRSRGMSNGHAGATLRRVALLPDPLEAYMDRPAEGVVYSTFGSFDPQTFANSLLTEEMALSLEQSTSQLTNLDSSTHLAYRKQPLSIFNHKVKTESGADVSRSGTASIINLWPDGAKAIDSAVPLGYKNAFNFGYAAGYLMGHTFHELGHGFGLRHSSQPLRGPSADAIMQNQYGFSLVAGLLQTLGVGASETGQPISTHLLGSPEIDTRLAINGNASATPTKAWQGPRFALLTSSIVFWDTANLRKLLTHPAFSTSELLGEPLNDPLARVAWPRDVSFMKLSQTDGSDMPPAFFQLVDDSALSGGDSLSYAGLHVFCREGEGTDDKNPDSYSCLWEVGSGSNAVDLKLYQHYLGGSRFDGFGFDADESHSDIFHAAFPMEIYTETGTSRGAVGPGGCDSLRVFFDHEENRSGIIFNRPGTTDREIIYKYVVSYSGAPPTQFDGSFTAPFPSLETAVSAGNTTGWSRFILLPRDNAPTNIQSLLRSDNVFHTSGVTLPNQGLVAIIGGGSTPDVITLRASSSSFSSLIGSGALGVNNVLCVGNMTIDGAGSSNLNAIDIAETGGGVHLGNLIIKDFTDGAAIKVGTVRAGGLFATNNTIINCETGIDVVTVTAVTADDQNGYDGYFASVPMGLKSLGRSRVFYNSAVENNLIVWTSPNGHSTCAIKIGTGSSAAAWNPFDDAFAGETGGNPIVPVRNNMVWNCGWNPAADGGAGAQDDAYAFQGDLWYQSVSSPGSLQHYGVIVDADETGPILERQFVGEAEAVEWVSNPLFLSETHGDPDYLRLSNTSPARNLGNPYRIDIYPGDETASNPRVARRSIGAFASENLEGDYEYLQQ